MADILRIATYQNKQDALEKGRTFSMEEITDVVRLIATRQWPDASFSDNECNLWEMFRRELNIDY